MEVIVLFGGDWFTKKYQSFIPMYCCLCIPGSWLCHFILTQVIVILLSIQTRRLKWHWMEVTLNLPAKEWCPVDPPNTNNINVCDWNENITMKIGPTSSILSYDFGFGCQYLFSSLFQLHLPLSTQVTRCMAILACKLRPPFTILFTYSFMF